MKNAYLRNLMISVTAHVACVYVLIAFSFGSCRSRRPLRDLAVFVDFQPGPPPAVAPVSAPERPIAEPADVPEPIPEPLKPKTKPAEVSKKPKVKISTNLVRRAAPAGARQPVKQLSAAQVRRMLETAVASVGAPAGASGGAGETAPYDWYLGQVRAVMYDAWAQPSALAGERGLVTRVLVRVRPDGRIVQKKMIATSGNGLMDTSVMTAVESVENLPELPFGFGGAYKDITIDFELEDTGP